MSFLMAFLDQNWRLVMIGALVGGNVIFYELWQGSVEKHKTYVAVAEAAGRQAQYEKKIIEARGVDNLNTVKAEYEANLPKVRSDAVAAYLAHQRLRTQPSGGGSVSDNAPGIKVDDGAGRQCVFDEVFIQDAAECESKLGAWQRYGQLNHLPVE